MHRVYIPSVLSLTFLTCTYPPNNEVKIMVGGQNTILGFQLISVTGGSIFLFDATDLLCFVCCTCPHLCQIKGQCLDGVAILLFILVQPRERPNKSRRNVVTREVERSLPTGRDSLSLKVSSSAIFFFFLLQNVTFKTRTDCQLF